MKKGKLASTLAGVLRLAVPLTAIAALMGALLWWVHDVTAAPIAQAETRAKVEALAQVLPPFDNDPSSTARKILSAEGDKRPVTLYAATKDGQPVGYAVETYTSEGFSGDITMMVGFDAHGAVTGYRVLQHAETPGLGAKAQAWFADTTGSRSILGTASPLAVRQDGGSVDGITAATITSRAFLDAVNRARQAIERKPLVRKN